MGWMGIGPFSSFSNNFLATASSIHFCVAIRLKQPLYRHPWDDMASVALSPPSTTDSQKSLASGIWDSKDITYISELAGQA